MRASRADVVRFLDLADEFEETSPEFAAGLRECASITAERAGIHPKQLENTNLVAEMVLFAEEGLRCFETVLRVRGGLGDLLCAVACWTLLQQTRARLDRLETGLLDLEANP